MNHSDSALWQKAKLGDRDAFGVLYDRHVRAIYSYIYHRTLRKETAEDITSTVFIKALEKMSQFTDRGEGSFLAWLYTIARTTVIDHVRKNGRLTALPSDYELPERQASAPQTEAQIDAHHVLSALNSLSAVQRDIVLLRLWDEQTFKEIAATIGKSDASCKMHYSRAVQSLRKILLVLIAVLIPHL